MGIRIALLTPWFGENMGYIENALPPALAELGAEVRVVSSQLQPHFSRDDYAESFGRLNGPAVQPAGLKWRRGYELMRLPYVILAGHVALRGLGAALASFRPDVVQTFSPVSWVTAQAAALKPRLGYRLFTGAHRAAVDFALTQPFPDRRLVTRLSVSLLRTMPGRMLDRFSEGCFAVTQDCATIAVRYFGVPERKIVLSPMGVDTGLFHPISGSAGIRSRKEERSRHGFRDHEIVCLYSGQLVESKGVIDLAEAIHGLRSDGRPFAGLFVGGGPLWSDLEGRPGITLERFVPWAELPRLYRSADIAVWPRKYSISQLDAAACGLPLVLSDRIQAPERVDGIAITSAEGDVDSLKEALLQLTERSRRELMGATAADRMLSEYSWLSRAAERMAYYSSRKT